MAMRQDIGDQVLARTEIDVPYVESFMSIPLSKNVHFVTNDCQYSRTRYESIAHWVVWVHPLFLKAKGKANPFIGAN